MKTSTLKNFTKYVSLSVLGMLGLSCYILADTFFVARGIGANGLAALNLAIPVYSFINGAGLMIGMGAATRYSISKSKSSFTQALYFIALIAAIFVIAGLFLADNLATLLGTDADTYQMTVTYLKVIMCFTPMFMLNNLIICFVRNDGDPKLSMAAMQLGSLSNIILDYVFVFPLNMGMFGAALATGIAPVVSLCVLSSHFIKKKNKFRAYKLRLNFQSLFDISSLGISALITELSSGVVIIVFNSLILSIEGNLGVAAYGIIANIALVVLSIFTGISQGVQPLMSKSYGQNDNSVLKQLLKYELITVIALASGAYIILFTFAEPIVALFNKDQNIQLANMATAGLRIYFTAFLFAGINIMSAAFFSAIARPKNAFLISLLRGFAVIIPISLAFSWLFGMTGIWISMTVTEFIVLFYSVIKMKQEK